MSRSAQSSSDFLTAAVNALKLGSSLLGTLVIAVAMKLLVPRYLGPAAFGTLNFADGLATMSFVVLNLGAEAYIRKEVSIRLSHASDFLGGALLLRLLMSGLIFGLMACTLQLLGRTHELLGLVFLFGGAQFFISTNATLSALLHARGRIGGMSAWAVVSKVIWASGCVATIVLHAGLMGFAVAVLVAESIECVALSILARRHLGLVLRVDVTATKAMVVGSLPYFLNGLACGVYGKLDVSLLGLLSTGKEVGWYAAATTITGLALLITPIIDWVLAPMLARAAVQSHDVLYAYIRQATEPILAVAIPMGLFISVGADVWLQLLFGRAFAPAVLALRTLAVSSVVIYVAIIYSITLIMIERAWTLTLVSLGSLVVNLALNLVLIPVGATHGQGGAGVGCAAAALGTYVFSAGVMIAIIGHRAIDRRTLVMVCKSLVACVLVVGIDRLASCLGALRLVVDVVAYLGIAVGTGALRVRELLQLVVGAARKKATTA